MKITEKRDGAKSVQKWSANIQRDYRPYFALGGSKPVVFDPDMVTVNFSVEFWSLEDAEEFYAKILAMMPEAE